MHGQGQYGRMAWRTSMGFLAVLLGYRQLEQTMSSPFQDPIERFVQEKRRGIRYERGRARRGLARGVEGVGWKLRNDARGLGSATGYRKCSRWGCDFNITAGKEYCPGCGFPRKLWRRVLVYLGIAERGRPLRPAEAEAWQVIDRARDEWQKLATLEGDLTGYHKPKLTPEQKAAIERGEAQISRKAQAALKRLKEIEVARWQTAGSRLRCVSQTRASAMPN